MKEETLPLLPDRRHLLTRVLPAGALACLACRGAFAATEPVKSGSGARVEMSYDDMFSMFYDIPPFMKTGSREEMKVNNYLKDSIIDVLGVIFVLGGTGDIG